MYAFNSIQNPFIDDGQLKVFMDQLPHYSHLRNYIIPVKKIGRFKNHAH